MATPVKTIRRETGLIEGICSHGIGHPLYASADWMARATQPSEVVDTRDTWMVHGCDGCCQDSEWIISTLTESVEIANQIIIQHKEVINILTEGSEDD